MSRWPTCTMRRAPAARARLAASRRPASTCSPAGCRAQVPPSSCSNNKHLPASGRATAFLKFRDPCKCNMYSEKYGFALKRRSRNSMRPHRLFGSLVAHQNRELLSVICLFEPLSRFLSAGPVVEVQRMACAQHRLLGAREAAGRAAVLLGLTDDVDCALLNVSITSGAASEVSTEPVAAGNGVVGHQTLDAMGAIVSASDGVSASFSASAGASVSAGASSNGSQAAVAGAAIGEGDQSSGPQILVKHVSSIPALAYVAAGKVQSKHLLLGAPGALLVMRFSIYSVALVRQARRSLASLNLCND